MSEPLRHAAYFLGLSTERLHYARLIDFILAAVWAMIAYREYGVDNFLFGFALLMCGVRLGMSTQR